MIPNEDPESPESARLTDIIPEINPFAATDAQQGRYIWDDHAQMESIVHESKLAFLRFPFVKQVTSMEP